MKNYKTFLISLFVGLLMVLSITILLPIEGSMVSAEPSITEGIKDGVEGATGKDKILKLIGNVRGIILGSGAALAILVILVGGAVYITSTGNEERVALARKLITYAIVGLILIILAEVILTIYTNLLGSDYVAPKNP